MTDRENELDLARLYALMRPRNICICRAVSENDLVSAVHNGCDTIEKLIERTSASTKCGSCSFQVNAIFEREMNIISAEKNDESKD